MKGVLQSLSRKATEAIKVGYHRSRGYAEEKCSGVFEGDEDDEGNG